MQGGDSATQTPYGPGNRQPLSVARIPEGDIESFLETAAQELEGWK
jgi:hypothetical protein